MRIRDWSSDVCSSDLAGTTNDVRKRCSLGEAGSVEQSLQVRRINRRDTSAYYTLRARSVEGLLHPAEPEVLRELGGGHARLAGRIDHYDVEGTRVWGVFHADILAGAIALSRHFHLQHLDTVFLWGLFVYHRYRGTATSRLLMEAAMDWYEHEPGIESVVTRFDGSNLPARQYFERFGFEGFERPPPNRNEDWRVAGLVHMRRQKRKGGGEGKRGSIWVSPG